MRIERHLIENLNDPIRDLDIDETGNVAYIVKDSIFLNGNMVNLDIPYSFRMRQIRFFESTILVLGTCDVHPYYHSLLIDYEGGEPLREYKLFSSDIQDLVNIHNWSVFGFGDTALGGPSAHIKNGTSVIHYHEVFEERIGKDLPAVDHVYCMATDGGSRLFCISYPDFPLLTWDLDTFSAHSIPLPREVHFPLAVSAMGNVTFVYKHEEDGRRLIYMVKKSFDGPTSHVKVVGELSPDIMSNLAIPDPESPTWGKTFRAVRGIPGGRFLIVHNDGYSMVYPMEIKSAHRNCATLDPLFDQE